MWSFGLVLNSGRRILGPWELYRLTVVGVGLALFLPSGAADLAKARWGLVAHGSPEEMVVSSVVATLAQGIALGALLQGIKVEGRAYAGGWWDWLSPFSILVGIGLLFGYGLLGATWLAALPARDAVLRPGFDVQAHGRHLAFCSAAPRFLAAAASGVLFGLGQL